MGYAVVLIPGEGIVVGGYCLVGGFEIQGWHDASQRSAS